MGANQSIDAGYACVGEDLSEVDKQYLITHTFLQKQGAREHGPDENTGPSKNADQATLTPPFFIASFSGSSMDRAMVAEAMKTAMTQPLDGSVQHSSDSNAPVDTQAAARALENAVCVQDGASVRHLVYSEGCELDTYSQEGMTVLHLAAARGSADIISVLVLLGANIDAKTHGSGDTALHMSAAAGGLNNAARMDCLEMLTSLGAGLDLPNKDGRAPLHVAAMSGNMKAVERLLAAGARRAILDKDDMRPADLAEAFGAHGIYEYLTGLDAKAQVDKIKQYQQWL